MCREKNGNNVKNLSKNDSFYDIAASDKILVPFLISQKLSVSKMFHDSVLMHSTVQATSILLMSTLVKLTSLSSCIMVSKRHCRLQMWFGNP
jgi:hypothetical protein